VLSLAISSETLEIRPALLYSDRVRVRVRDRDMVRVRTRVPRRISTDPMCMTLNDLECLLHVLDSFLFRAGTFSVGDCDIRKQLRQN